MNSHSIYTRKTLGLDNKVWRSFLIMIIFALGLMSYRVMTNDEKRTQFFFKANSLSLRENGVYYVGDVLSFTASISSENIDWDFGDNTSGVGENVHHQYMKEGKFLVKAGGNSLVPYQIEITIQNPPTVVPVPHGWLEGPTTSYTKTIQNYSYVGANDSCEWTILGQPSFGIKTGKNVSFKFLSQASYTIHVVLNGDIHKWLDLDVFVKDEVKLPLPNDGKKVPPDDRVLPPLPPLPVPNDTVVVKPEPPPPPEVIGLAPATLLYYLEKVQANAMTLAEFKPYGIVESTPVIANGKEKQNFKWLCEEIMKTKKKWKRIDIKRTILRVKLKTTNIQRINKDVSLIEITYDYE